MALPSYKTKSEIPTGFEELYEERDGAWHPKQVPDVAKLEGTLEKVRGEKKEEERARRAAEEARAALERQLAAATTGEDRERVTKALAKFDADLATAKAAFEAEKVALQGQLRTLQLDDKFTALFSSKEIGGRPEKAKAALALNRGRLDLAEDGRIVVKDEKGSPTSVSIADFLAKTFRAEMPEFYKGSQGAGGNAPGGAGGTVVTRDRAAELLDKNPLALLEEANAATAGAH